MNPWRIDMDPWHLIWIVPLSFTVGLLAFIPVYAAVIRHAFRDQF